MYVRATIDTQNRIHLIDPSPFNLVDGTVYDPCAWIDVGGEWVHKFTLHGDLLTVHHGVFESTVQLTTVPVPGALLLFGCAIIGLAVVKRIFSSEIST